ncbi:Nitrogen assimilation transcription factor nirA, partial [Lachnellula suecica]
MRAEIERLRQYQQQSQRVLDALASDTNTADIIDQLRNGERLEGISRKLESSPSASTYNQRFPTFNQQSSNTLDDMMSWTPEVTQSSSANGSPIVFEHWIENTPEQTSIETARDHGQQFILGDEATSSDPLKGHGPKYHGTSWTRVTSDGALIEHLLALYFCWEYPIFATVSQEHFMEDFRRGQRRYCSSLLVNALLALACRFSDRPSTRPSPEDRTTAGDAFFAEAQRLFKAETNDHVLTTVQALGVMSIREASCGRIAESSYLSSQSIRLAVEMGLHMENADVNNDDDKTEKQVSAATFWGALSLNEMLSLCTGTLPHLSRHANLPTKPAIIQHVEDAFWAPYTDDGTPLDQIFEQPSNLRSVYKTFCSEVNSKALVSLYNQYIQWYDTIPESLRLGHNYTPAVLFAHLFYHSTTLLLFQPFINLELTTSSS